MITYFCYIYSALGFLSETWQNLHNTYYYTYVLKSRKMSKNWLNHQYEFYSDKAESTMFNLSKICLELELEFIFNKAVFTLF